MLRLLPFIICVALGFALGFLMFHRRRDGPSSDEWQAKYHELNHRYRDLTRRLKELDKTSRYRTALSEVLSLLERPHGISPDLAQSKREEIRELLADRV